MKNPIRWLAGLVLLATTLNTSAMVIAQDAASVNWPLISSTQLSAVTDGAVTGAPATGAGGLVLRNQQSANNGPLGEQMQRWWLDNVAWPVEEEYNEDRYIQFSVAPDGAVSFNATSISMALAKQGTDNFWVAIAYDTDADFTSPVFLETELELLRDNVSPGYTIEEYTIDVTVDPGDLLYVRVYPFTTAGGATRYLNIQDVWVEGTTEEAALEGDPASGNWPMTEANPSAVIVDGSVEGTPAQGDPGNNLVLRDHSGPEGPLGNMQRWWLGGEDWPIETEHDPNRYAQWTLSPTGGVVFNASSISVTLSSSGTSNMTAAIQYSTNADFSDPVLLSDGDVIRDTDVGVYTVNTYPISETVGADETIYLRIFPYVRSGSVGSGRNIMFQDVWIEGTTDSAMPVELTSFIGTVDGNDAVLRWSVASETNNAGFSIERRADGAFQSVGFVEGRGTTSEPGEYGYRVADLSPGVHVFRLRQVDFGGAVAYSPAVELTVEVPGDFMLTAPYPNPFNPQTTLEFAVAHSRPVTATLYDALGRQVEVLYDGTPAANETQTLHVDGSGLTSGLYFVRLHSDAFSVVRRLVLVK